MDADDAFNPAAAPARLFCGGPEQVELFEIWGSHEFMISTCCEHLHASVVQEMADDPEWGRALLRRLGAEEIMGVPLRRLADDGVGGLVLDWQLRTRPVRFTAARDFVRHHHAHCTAPAAWRFGQAILNGGTMLGVVMVGNPVAPALNGRGTVEVNRLCIRRDIPRVLAWNAASQLYGWAAREAARQGWTHIITYTRADEDGISVRAAGWQQEARIRGRGWHSSRRARSNTNAWVDKIRWGKPLKSAATRRKESCRAPSTNHADSLSRALFGYGPSGADRLAL